jgi:hypothetical protein
MSIIRQGPGTLYQMIVISLAAAALAGNATGQCEDQIIVSNSGRDVELGSGHLIAANHAFGSFEVYTVPGWVPRGGGTAELVTICDDGEVAVTRRGTAPNFVLDFWRIGGPTPILLDSLPHPHATSIDLLTWDNYFGASFNLLLIGNVLSSTVEVWEATFDGIGTHYGPSNFPNITSPVEDFGWDVEGAFDPNTGRLMVAVGAPRADVSTTNGGRVEFWLNSIFNAQPWTFVDGLDSVITGAEFGTSVAVDWNSVRQRFVAASGAPQNNLNGANAGAVSFFEEIPGAGLFNVTNTVLGTQGTNLGFAVAVSENWALAGAPATSSPSLAGAAELYAWTGSLYSPQTSVVNSHSWPGDGYGFAVALDKGPFTPSRAAVSAPTHPNGPRVAIFDAFSVMSTTWVVQNLGFGLAGSFGMPFLTGTGPRCQDSTMSLNLTGVPPGSMAFLIIGTSQLNQPFMGGTLVPNLNSFITLRVSGSGDLSLSGTYPATAPSIPHFFQYWIEDPAGPQGFSASNALQVTPP